MHNCFYCGCCVGPHELYCKDCRVTSVGANITPKQFDAATNKLLADVMEFDEVAHKARRVKQSRVRSGNRV